MRCRQCDSSLPPEARFCLSCGAPVERSAPDSAADPLLEALTKAIGFQYRIERPLGRGGMGAVYLAHEFALDRDVAIKVLPPEHASTPEMRERFRREARTAARLSHPHIVPLLTFGEVSGLVYYVMGYIAGESLAARLKRLGPLDPEDARTLLVGICEALDYAHRQGIVHRDIKPDNILLDSVSGAPLLTDFGIAKPSLEEAHLTATGQLIGTPHYMSPEQAAGRSDVGPRSDLYSLGVAAYEMVSGRLPFEAESLLEALTQRLTRDPKPIGSIKSDVPPDLALAITRCLQRDPANRWPDARSLREALLPFDEDSVDPITVRFLRTVLSILLLGCVGSAYVAIFAALNPDLDSVQGLGVLFPFTVTFTGVVALAGGIVLRLQGLDVRSILTKVLQQPLWWRWWYPRSLRRRGDVWARLPRELRRFRMVWSLCLVYMIGIFLPLQFLYLHQRAIVWFVLNPSGLAVLILLFASRRRTAKYINARLAGASANVSAILNMPTCRVSFWRRPPTSSLLAAQGQAPTQAPGGSRTALTQTLGS